MSLQKIWMSPDTARKSRYNLRAIGGIAAIVAGVMLLVCGGVWLSFALDLPRKAFSLFLVCGAAALAAALALKLGWRLAGDATVFFLTDDDRLYVADARARSNWGHGLPGFVSGTLETQACLRALADSPHVPSGAAEIQRVEAVKETGSHYVIRCRARQANGRPVPRTYFLVKGYADEEALLRQLERRQTRRCSPEFADSRTALCTSISAMALIACAVLCVLSHPAVGRLPQAIYFPCLWASFAAACALACFVIRLRRGD